MIRATLTLATVVLAGIAAVWWTARQLDPLRALERIVPAQVRTVDLSGSGPFLRPRPAEPPQAAPRREPPRELGAEATPGALRAATAPEVRELDVPQPEVPEPVPADPVLPDRPTPESEVPDETVVVHLKPSGDFSEGLEAPAAPPAPAAVPRMHPDASAALIRRMLSLHARAGGGQ